MNVVHAATRAADTCSRSRLRDRNFDAYNRESSYFVVKLRVNRPALRPGHDGAPDQQFKCVRHLQLVELSPVSTALGQHL